MVSGSCHQVNEHLIQVCWSSGSSYLTEHALPNVDLVFKIICIKNFAFQVLSVFFFKQKQSKCIFLNPMVRLQSMGLKVRVGHDWETKKQKMQLWTRAGIKLTPEPKIIHTGCQGGICVDVYVCVCVTVREKKQVLKKIIITTMKWIKFTEQSLRWVI